MPSQAIPMPVKISSAESLAPFFDYLAQDGSFESRGDITVQLEPYYEEPYIEFEKGVLYRDQRMDLCKMYVVKPQLCCKLTHVSVGWLAHSISPLCLMHYEQILSSSISF